MMLGVVYKCVKSHNMNNNLWMFYLLTYLPCSLSLSFLVRHECLMLPNCVLLCMGRMKCFTDKQPQKWKICRKLLSYQVTFDPWRLTVYLTLVNFISFLSKRKTLPSSLPADGATTVSYQKFASCDEKTYFMESWGEFLSNRFH